jgi:hypothetical protein
MSPTRQGVGSGAFGGLLNTGSESARFGAGADFVFGGAMPFIDASPVRAGALAGAVVGAVAFTLAGLGTSGTRVELVSRAWARSSDAPARRMNPAIRSAGVRMRSIR